jgi:ribosomal protein S5
MADKAGETVGAGIAMASDVAGAIETAIGAAVTAVAEVLKSTPVKKAAKKTAPKKVSKKSSPKKATKKIVTTKTAKKAPAKKVAKKLQPQLRKLRRKR